MWDAKFTGSSISQEKITPWLLAALYQLGGSAHWTDAVEKTRDIINVSDEILERVEGGDSDSPYNYFEKQCKFSCSISRALEYIKPSDSGQRGVWELAEKGAEKVKELLGKDDFKPIKKFINSVEKEYQIYLDSRPKTQQKNNQDHSLENQEIQNILEGEDTETLSIQNDLKTIVDDNVVKPYQFELLCIQLLNAMGADMQETKQSGDHGIDGEGHISIGLLSFKVVIQVKRYHPDTKITEAQINNLLGAKVNANAEKAIFITTSSYAKAAREAARKNSIRLIDGEELIKLMKDHKVGYNSILKLKT